MHSDAHHPLQVFGLEKGSSTSKVSRCLRLHAIDLIPESGSGGYKEILAFKVVFFQNWAIHILDESLPASFLHQFRSFEDRSVNKTLWGSVLEV